MRMWMIDPSKLCRKHLLGEHGEIHKHRHNFVKGHSIAGRLRPVVQIEPMSMKSRHDELAEEMTRRGYRHKSPYRMPSLKYLSQADRTAAVDVWESAEELKRRCVGCFK